MTGFQELDVIELTEQVRIHPAGTRGTIVMPPHSDWLVVEFDVDVHDAGLADWVCDVPVRAARLAWRRP